MSIGCKGYVMLYTCCLWYLNFSPTWSAIQRRYLDLYWWFWGLTAWMKPSIWSIRTHMATELPSSPPTVPQHVNTPMKLMLVRWDFFQYWLGLWYTLRCIKLSQLDCNLNTRDIPLWNSGFRVYAYWVELVLFWTAGNACINAIVRKRIVVYQYLIIYTHPY